MGHEYVGIVEEVGSEVRSINPGQFVVGSFWASDNTSRICRAGYRSRCVHAELMGTIGTQAELARCRSPTAPWSPPPTFRRRSRPEPARCL
jgi:threonine dehydrogenase-like Zn-dependent dehydrogenase